MIILEGLCWPDDVGLKWQHALRHVGSLEWALARCRSYRTAVQAGGNIGLWPRRMAERFARVLTFEPDEASRACLVKNVPICVEVRAEALGDSIGRVAMKHRSLGSHRIVDGDTVRIVPLDSLGLLDVDLLQLDVEGYEWHALAGARQTILRSSPLIQVELRDYTQQYQRSDDQVRALLGAWGYREVSRQQGSDVVFERSAA